MDHREISFWDGGWKLLAHDNGVNSVYHSSSAVIILFIS
jgi:hypothetical protein